MKQRSIKRRGFLKTVAASLAFPWVVPKAEADADVEGAPILAHTSEISIVGSNWEPMHSIIIHPNGVREELIREWNGNEYVVTLHRLTGPGLDMGFIKKVED